MNRLLGSALSVLLLAGRMQPGTGDTGGRERSRARAGVWRSEDRRYEYAGSASVGTRTIGNRPSPAERPGIGAGHQRSSTACADA